MAYRVTIEFQTADEVNMFFRCGDASKYCITDVSGTCEDPNCHSCVDDKLNAMPAEAQEALAELHESHDDPHLNPGCLLCLLHLKSN